MIENQNQIDKKMSMSETKNSRKAITHEPQMLPEWHTSSCKAEAEVWLPASLKFKFPKSSDNLLMKKG